MNQFLLMSRLRRCNEKKSVFWAVIISILLMHTIGFACDGWGFDGGFGTGVGGSQQAMESSMLMWEKEMKNKFIILCILAKPLIIKASGLLNSILPRPSG